MKQIKPQMKTMQDIRELLSATMDSLQAKDINPSAANALCNTTGKFLSTIKLEMEFAKMIGKQPSENFLKLMSPSVEKLQDQRKAA